MAVASRILDGVTRASQGPHRLLGLNVSTANTSVHIAVKWPLAQDASLSPRWGLPPGGLVWPCPVKEITVSSPLLSLSKSCLSLHKPRPLATAGDPQSCPQLSLPPESRPRGPLASWTAPGPTAHVKSPCLGCSGCVGSPSKPAPLPSTVRPRPPPHSQLPGTASTKLCRVHSQTGLGSALLPSSSSTALSQTPPPRPAVARTHWSSGISGKQRLPLNRPVAPGPGHAVISVISLTRPGRQAVFWPRRPLCSPLVLSSRALPPPRLFTPSSRAPPLHSFLS